MRTRNIFDTKIVGLYSEIRGCKTKMTKENKNRDKSGLLRRCEGTISEGYPTGTGLMEFDFDTDFFVVCGDIRVFFRGADVGHGFFALLFAAHVGTG